MLHHISLAVTDLDRAASFYDAALGELGFVRVWTAATAIGYGPVGEGDGFAIKLCGSERSEPPAAFHLAFAAPDREAIETFHRAGIENGGHDNGGPGVRPEYGPDYYAAYVFDPDGHNIEAVINDTTTTEVSP